MKVNKKQNSLSNTNQVIRKNGMATQPRKRIRVRDASRNYNSQVGVAAAYSTGNSGRAPKVSASFDSCRVVHRELIGNVSGGATTAFTLANTFSLNPGLASTFPWLSNIAVNWETYHFSKLRFCYYTRCGTNTFGSVVIAPDYDASDASPITEGTVSSYIDVQEDAPYKDIVCNLRSSAMHPMGPKKFLRTGALAVNQDIKTYDVGNLFICTVDSAAAAGWGKLWVEYDVTFFTPQLPSSGSSFSGVTIMSLDDPALSAANLFSSALQTISGGLGATFAVNTCTLPNLIIGAEYNVSIIVRGTVVSALTFVSNVGLTLKTTIANVVNAGATNMIICRTFIASATNATIVFSITAATVTGDDVMINLIPSDLAGY